jgi:hypothetical protein
MVIVLVDQREPYCRRCRAGQMQPRPTLASTVDINVNNDSIFIIIITIAIYQQNNHVYMIFSHLKMFLIFQKFF